MNTWHSSLTLEVEVVSVGCFGSSDILESSLDSFDFDNCQIVMLL